MHTDLFSAGTALMPIPLAEGELYFAERLALGLAPRALLQRLIEETVWRAESVTIGGRRHLQPRLIAWYGDPGTGYTYSGILLEPAPWPPLIAHIKEAIEALTQRRFNSVLLNYYRDQRDSMGMHSDDEAELGAAPAIASLSIGQARTFILKPKHNKAHRQLKVVLGDGNVLLMAGATQKNWLHGLPKQSQPCGPRINLTFRHIHGAPGAAV